MDNPKIIRIDAGTELNSPHQKFTIDKTQNFIVVSETENMFFVKMEGNVLYSVKKSKIKYVTFKNRTIPFNDLKKNEILNLIDNYQLLIQKAQQISKEISKYRMNEHDMSLNRIIDLQVTVENGFMVLTHTYLDEQRVCHVPMKYLWDHNWKKNLQKDYSKSF